LDPTRTPDLPRSKLNPHQTLEYSFGDKLELQPFSFRLKFGANQTETVAKPFQTGFKQFFGRENEQTG
jgi:hypothetical protein